MSQPDLESLRMISKFLRTCDGLSFNFLIVILELAEARRPLSYPDFSRMLGMSTAAVMGCMDRLTKLGLVTQVRNAQDQRKVEIALTERGETVARDFFQLTQA